MLQAALDCLKKVRDFRHPELELELLLGQAMAMRSVHGYSAPAVEQALLSARDIARDSGDFDTRFSVDWGIFQCTIVKGDVEGAKRDAAALLEQAGIWFGRSEDRWLSRDGHGGILCWRIRAINRVPRDWRCALSSGARSAALPDTWPKSRPVLPLLHGAHPVHGGPPRPRPCHDATGSANRRAQGIQFRARPQLSQHGDSRSTRPSPMWRPRGRAAACRRNCRHGTAQPLCVLRSIGTMPLGLGQSAKRQPWGGHIRIVRRTGGAQTDRDVARAAWFLCSVGAALYARWPIDGGQ